MKPRKVTALGDAILIHSHLKDRLTPNNDGTWSYPDGWNDARVAEECVGIDRNIVTGLHVANVRKRLFEPIRKLPVDSKDDRVAKLEARLAACEARLDAVGA